MYETVSLTALNYIFKKAGRKKEKKKKADRREHLQKTTEVSQIIILSHSLIKACN